MANVQAIESLRSAFASARSFEGSSPRTEVSSPTRSSNDVSPERVISNTVDRTDNDSTDAEIERSKRREPTPSPQRQRRLQEGTQLLNDMANTLNRDIEFEVIGSQDIVQATITNPETGEEIRSIPSDEVILLQEKIDAFMGLFVDEFR